MDVPDRDAVNVTVVSVVTADVSTFAVTLLCPAGTTTDVGTVAFALPDDNATDVPPEGAGPLNVMVICDESPPATDVGLMAKLLRAAFVTLSTPVAVTPFRLAVMLASVSVATAFVVMVNVADV